MRHTRILTIGFLAAAIAILTGCENLTLGYKYGDWKWEHEFKLKEIDKIEININEIKDQAVQDTANPAAPVVAQPKQEEAQ